MQLRFISLEDREPFALGALRKLSQSVDSDLHHNAIRQVMRNRQLRRAFIAEAWTLYQADMGEDGRLLEFFQWILDNSDEIIALIMKLLPLFV